MTKIFDVFTKLQNEKRINNIMAFTIFEEF